MELYAVFGYVYTLTSDHTLDSLLKMFLRDGVREVASRDQRCLVTHVSNVSAYQQTTAKQNQNRI